MENKEVKDALIEALGSSSMEGGEEALGMTDQPVKPLAGSENVPISPEEEKTIE